MSEKSGPKCKVCGRPLRDPVSVAIGAGPACRGQHGRTSRRSVARANRRARRERYDAGMRFAVGEMEFVPVSTGWLVGDCIMSHEQAGRYLSRQGLLG